MPITRLNHAVLFVRDVDRASAFYREAFGFEEIERPDGMRAAFMRSPTGGNHHDLGLFEVGPAALKPPRGSVVTKSMSSRWPRAIRIRISSSPSPASSSRSAVRIC